MRILTDKERREIKKELKRSGFDLKEMRIVADCKVYDGFWMLGLNCIDKEKMQRICIPLKCNPTMSAIREQLKKLAPHTFLNEVEPDD